MAENFGRGKHQIWRIDHDLPNFSLPKLLAIIRSLISSMHIVLPCSRDLSHDFSNTSSSASTLCHSVSVLKQAS